MKYDDAAQDRTLASGHETREDSVADETPIETELAPIHEEAEASPEEVKLDVVPEATKHLGVAETVAHLREGARERIAVTRKFRAAQLKAFERMMSRHESDFVTALAQDLGKSAVEARLTELSMVRNEVKLAQLYLTEWMGAQHQRMPIAFQPAVAKVEPQPLGLVLIMGPWNYPVNNLLIPLVSAIAAGNCAVIKPSENAPTVSALLERLVPRYLDHRAVAVVTGGADVAAELLEQKWDHIFFTGSERIGRKVYAAAAQQLTPVTLELGGKCPVVVVDGNWPAIARRIAFAKFTNAGQTCVAPDYVLAVGRAADELEKHLPRAIAEFYGKDPSSSKDFGRIVNESHVDRLTGYLADGDVVAGGIVDRAHRYVAPTILKNVDPASPVMQEEIFGPILPIIRVANVDEAIDFIGNRSDPLAAYLFSERPRLHAIFEDHVRAGSIGIGVAILQTGVTNLPFGGVGNSGTGNYHGKYGFDTFSQLRPTLAKTTMVDTLKPVYPPYGWAKSTMVKRAL